MRDMYSRWRPKVRKELPLMAELLGVLLSDPIGLTVVCATVYWLVYPLLPHTGPTIDPQCLQASTSPHQPWGQYNGSHATQAVIEATAELADPRHTIQVHLLDDSACAGTATYWSGRS